MTDKHKKEPKPWQPHIEREPEFNAFVNPRDASGALENPPPLDELDSDEDSNEDGPAGTGP